MTPRPLHAALLTAGIIAAVAVALRPGGDGGDVGDVSVYPNDRTLAASAGTTITLRGADLDLDELDGVTVVGSRSGYHEGRWDVHPDRRGATFVPDRPFAPGERVTVDAGADVAGATDARSSFVVAQVSDAEPAAYDEAKPPADRGVQRFRSRPDLRPPRIVVKTSSGGAAPGSVFVAPKRGATDQGPMIVDEAGDLVWFHPLDGDEQAFDFRAQSYRGKPVLTWWQGRMQTYRGAGVGRIVDASYRPVATVRAANGYALDAHELLLTRDGTALVMSYVVVPWDLSKLGGSPRGLVEDNVVQEIDVESGALLFEWHALGTIGLGESYRPAPKSASKVHDPFHLNSIDLDDDGNLLISARHTSAIYKLDRRTGDVLWRLGGKESSFEMRAGTTFKLQHDARRRADGTITLFDNVSEELPARGKQSRGMALALDEERMRATLVREFEHPDGLLSPTQGSMQALDGGGAFVGWGGLQPVVSEFDAAGRTVFDARFDAEGVESYRAYRMPWRASARGRPAVAVAAAGGRTRVSVSWNGATDVAAWRVRSAGVAATTAPRKRFETTVDVRGRPRAVVVDALDASGDVLATSARTRVRSER